MSLSHPKKRAHVPYYSLTLEERYGYWATHQQDLKDFLDSEEQISEEGKLLIMSQIKSITTVLNLLKKEK
jgi:hypothetical protein